MKWISRNMGDDVSQKSSLCGWFILIKELVPVIPSLCLNYCPNALDKLAQ